MDFLRGKRIAITGHTSGIGKEIYEICKFAGAQTVDGLSRQNGFNMLELNGDTVINHIIHEDYDIVFNHAYMPDIQNRILKVLYKRWKDRPGKIIINTGSTAGYYPHGLPTYEQNKLEMAKFCIKAGRDFPNKNKCRIQNLSVGYTNSAWTVGISREHLIDAYDVALLLVNMAANNEYYVSEMVVHKPYPDDETMEQMSMVARVNGGKDIEESYQDLEKKIGNNSLQ